MPEDIKKGYFSADNVLLQCNLHYTANRDRGFEPWTVIMIR